MSRHRRRPVEEAEPVLDMSSLIDVSFLLLIYFLVTSTLDPKEADLGMKLPTTETSAANPVEIDPDSPWRLRSTTASTFDGLMIVRSDVRPSWVEPPMIHERSVGCAQEAVA